MSFAYPWLVPALVLPLGLLVWRWRTPGERVILPVDHVGGQGGRLLGGLLNVVDSLPVLLLAVAILLLAGPQRLAAPKTRRVLTNIEFCVDVSGSMVAPFGEGTRYDAAMEAINDFINYRPGDAFGLTIFGSSVLHWVPLTSDASAFRCAHPFLDPRVLPRWFGGGTRIALGLDACMKVLTSREEGDRMIILVSDGYSWDLANGNDQTIARKLKDHGIVVYTVHIAEGEPPGELHTIAEITGGQVFAAGDPMALKAVFKTVDSMQATRLEKTRPEVQDAFWPYCLTGLGLALALLLARLFGLRPTPW